MSIRRRLAAAGLGVFGPEGPIRAGANIDPQLDPGEVGAEAGAASGAGVEAGTAAG
jgi:hypothetical protein